MKGTIKIGNVICLILALCICISAQTKSQPNVKDYFLALPQKYFENTDQPNHDWMLVEKRGSIVDIKNGYLFAQGDGAQPSIWVCVFTKKEGNHLIAVQTTAGDTDDITHLYFYVYEQGKWKDVTKRTLPIKHNEKYRYSLPRYGHTIKVTLPSGKRLYEWEWDNEKFILKK